MAQAAHSSIPPNHGVQQAAAAIVQLINNRPHSPRQAEIEAIIAKIAPANPGIGVAPTSPLLTKIRETADRLRDAFDVQSKLPPGHPDDQAAQARIDDLQGTLEEFEEQIPSPPQSFVDLLALAEIARAGADVRDDGTMGEAEEDDVFLGPAARLIEAVLQFGGIHPHSMLAMSPAHAEHYREWRRLIDEHMREFENRDQTGMTMAESDADDARMSAHTSVIDALVERIFTVPARTWGDVMLYAQATCLEYWAGSDPEGPDMRRWLDDGPQSDHDDAIALAKLLEAIFTVAGIGHFAGEVRP